MTENTDDASAAELRERVDELEAQIEQQQQTIQQMLPSRRSLLKAGGAGAAALLAASATTGSASAATGTIGGPNNVFNWYAEEIRDKNDNTPITLPGDGSVDIDEQTITNADGSTIDGDALIGIPSTSQSTSLTLGGSFTVLDPDRPVFLALRLQAETDGSSTGDVRVNVDESGGSTGDYIFPRALAQSVLGSGAIVNVSGGLIVPAGASVQVENSSDPNNNNAIQDDRKFIL